MCDCACVHRPLWWTGSGLMAGSLLLALLLLKVDPTWSSQHLTLLSLASWAQQAALVLGAALIAAGLVVVRLAPSAAVQAASKVDADWYA